MNARPTVTTMQGQHRIAVFHYGIGEGLGCDHSQAGELAGSDLFPDESESLHIVGCVAVVSGHPYSCRKRSEVNPHRLTRS